jgi:hypothetical protein
MKLALFALSACVWSSLAYAQVQSSRAVETTKAYSQLRFVDAVASRGAQDPLGADVNAGSGTIQGLYISANVSSALSGYGFPAKLGFNPFQTAIGDPGTDPIKMGLRESVLELAYTPIQLQQKTVVDAAGKQTSTLDVKAVNVLTAQYKITLKNLDQLRLVNPNSVRIQSETVVPGPQVEDIRAAAERARLKALQRLSITGATTFTRIFDDAKQDQFGGSTNFSKGVHTPDDTKHPVTVDGTVGWSLFPEKGTLGRRYLFAPAAGITVTPAPDAIVKFQVTVNRHYGAGFKGIEGVADKTKKTEAILSQSVTLKTVNGQPLILTFKESHIGAGSVAFGVATEYSYKFDKFKLPGSTR